MKTSAVPTSKAKTAYALLSEIRRVILAEPKRFDQTTWLETKTRRMFVDTFPACNTVGCVAGWVVALTHERPCSFWKTEAAAINVLGIDGGQAFELFDAKSVTGKSQTLAHAESGAAHIAAFQRKYAKQLKAKSLAARKRGSR